RPVDLALILRLVAVHIEARINGIGERGLHAAIHRELREGFVAGAEILVVAAGKGPFVGVVAGGGLELERAGRPRRQAREGKAAASAGWLRGGCWHWHRRARAGRAIVEREHAL